jgi:glutamate 5-kinase
MGKKVREELPKARRLVVKVGTKLLCGTTGELDVKRMKALTHDLAEVWKQGREVVLVTSGAIGAGVGRLGLSRVPQTIPEKQAAAAVGQGILMHLYEQLFAQEGIIVAQVLLTREDITNRVRYLNARNTFENLFHYKVIPIVNENDTVAVEEIRFGDNDNLAALVACLIDADLLVLLTDMEGLFTEDPHKSKAGELIYQIEEITPEVEAFAGGKGSPLATGGMETKIQAAKITMEAGIPLVIASGLHEGTLLRILQGEEVGTLFVPRPERMQARKRWIAFGSLVQGRIWIDQGAVVALLRNGKSLLPSGVTDVEGCFEKGAIVSVVDPSGREVARGITNYSAEEIKLIKGKKTKEIRKLLGYKDEEVIHRDNLTVMADFSGH